MQLAFPKPTASRWSAQASCDTRASVKYQRELQTPWRSCVAVWDPALMTITGESGSTWFDSVTHYLTPVRVSRRIYNLHCADCIIIKWLFRQNVLWRYDSVLYITWYFTPQHLELSCSFRFIGHWGHFDAKLKNRKTSNISHTLIGNKIVDHVDVVGASPVGAALQLHLHSRLYIRLQWFGQRQLQHETRNIQVWGFGAA